MRLRSTWFLVLLIGASAARAADDLLDRVDDALSASAWHDVVRGRLSGALDLEAYDLHAPDPGLIQTTKDQLFNPRLSLFLDGQVGPMIYVFAQSRLNRGFDPSDGALELQLDEYAFRFTPISDGRFNFQVGKFATVVGNWTLRHNSWDNPFVTAPLPYENLTGIWDAQAASSGGQLLAWSGVRPKPVEGGFLLRRDRSVPIIWGPSYGTGVSTFGRLGLFDYAAEIKNVSLSSRPETWSPSQTEWGHPTFSARLGYVPDPAWDFGVSASTGMYLRAAAEATLPPGHDFGAYRQTVLAQDASFAWHHFRAWAEVYEARFAVPIVGNADTVSYYTEFKYTFTPQFFGAVRWNQQLFDTVPDGRGGEAKWGRNVWRIDLGPGYRFTPHTEIKLQFSVQREDAEVREFGDLLAAQFTVRF